MGAMASHITNVMTVYSTGYSGADLRKHKSSASLAFERGIHRLPVNSPHKGPVESVFICWRYHALRNPSIQLYYLEHFSALWTKKFFFCLQSCSGLVVVRYIIHPWTRDSYFRNFKYRLDNVDGNCYPPSTPWWDLFDFYTELVLLISHRKWMSLFCEQYPSKLILPKEILFSLHLIAWIYKYLVIDDYKET